MVKCEIIFNLTARTPGIYTIGIAHAAYVCLYLWYNYYDEQEFS